MILFEKVRRGSTRALITLLCEQARETGSVAVEAPQHCGRFECVAPHKRSSAASACGAHSTYTTPRHTVEVLSFNETY
ncbi:hypothetical protein [Dictyobacter vulcani]|uniref:hypothetical protein n=1 Tax=Dictyobacter vulcani TaxID=2607529 RepID=UPI001386E39D|nr:hypothetical protein [Dictyobacter vulcani]